jgi:hypothetical protein
MEQSMLKRRSLLLAFAFAALLLIIGGAAFAIWSGAENASREVATLHTAHMTAGDALASIRANVLLSAILTRDYLLDPDPAHAAHYADQFDEIRSETESSFRTLSAAVQSGKERNALDRLHREVAAYWDPTKIVLDWTPEQKNARRAAFLQERVRHREEIVELAAQVEQLMTANFSSERQRSRSPGPRALPCSSDFASQPPPWPTSPRSNAVPPQPTPNFVASPARFAPRRSRSAAIFPANCTIRPARC